MKISVLAPCYLLLPEVAVSRPSPVRCLCGHRHSDGQCPWVAAPKVLAVRGPRPGGAGFAVGSTLAQEGVVLPDGRGANLW